MSHSTKNVLELSDNFVSVAQSSPYGQIKALHNAVSNVWSALFRAKKTDGSSDSSAEKLTKELYGLANRMLYNADKYGLTASTSAGFAGSIENKLDELLDYLAGANPYADSTTMTQSAAQSAKQVMESFLPRSLPPQKKEESSKLAPTTKDETGEEAFARVQRMQEAERSGLLGGDVVGKGKTGPTIPAPPGSGFSRIPAVDVPKTPEVGIAFPKESPAKKPSFIPGQNPFAPVPSASLGPSVELPKSEREAELSKWESLVDNFVKLAK